MIRKKLMKKNLRKYTQVLTLLLLILLILCAGCKRRIMEYGEPFKKPHEDLQEHIQYKKSFNPNKAGNS
jgi:hypothetical protein